MQRIAHALLVVTALALPLAGCESVNNFDPSDWVPGDLFGTKKKLVGERKPVFPEGVPGLAPGVPPELMRDSQSPGGELQDQRPPAQRAAVEPEPKPKAKPRPKAQPKQQAEAPEPAAPAPAPVRRNPAASRNRSRRRGRPRHQRPGRHGNVQWPDPPPTRSRSNSLRFAARAIERFPSTRAAPAMSFTVAISDGRTSGNDAVQSSRRQKRWPWSTIAPA
jgi:hypothetical protein